MKEINSGYNHGWALHYWANRAPRYLRTAGQGRTITGYAIVFNRESAPLYSDEEEEIREVILPQAVTMDLLNKCDIKATLFHDRQLILARSKNGSGTLSYSVDSKGVSFSFEAPNDVDGDKALELIRRGDMTGCSFSFATDYYKTDYVSKEEHKRNGKNVTIYFVKKIASISDFTLTADPAYPTAVAAARDREYLGKRVGETFAKFKEERRRFLQKCGTPFRKF